MQISTIGIDLAKRVFQIHGVDRVGNIVLRRQLRRAQVSMNLLDFTVTPLWKVWETVAAEAAADGVELAESELIGLAPLASLLDVADHAGASSDAPTDARLAAAAAFLRLRDFSPLQALELRLAAVRRA